MMRNFGSMNRTAREKHRVRITDFGQIVSSFQVTIPILGKERGLALLMLHHRLFFFITKTQVL